MSKRMRTAGRLVAVGALAVLLTGCIKLNIDLSVSSDNKVSGNMVFAFSKQLLQLTGQSAQDVIGSAAPIPSDLPGLSSKPYDDGDFAGEEFTFSDVPLSQFANSGSDSLNIVRDGDVFKVSGVLDLSTDQTTGSANIPGLQDALSSADIRISITFPGAVSGSNGEIDGNTVTWRPKIGDRLELQATGSAIESGSSSTTTILLIAGIALVAVIVIVAVAMTMRRRRGAEAVPAMAGGPLDAPAVGQAPPAPPVAPPAPTAAPQAPAEPEPPGGVPPSVPPAPGS